MNKKNITLLISVGVFVIFGIITVTGILFTTANLVKTNIEERENWKNHEDFRGGKIIMKTYSEQKSLENIESIIIDNTYCNIKLVQNDDDMLTVDLDTFRFENSDNASPLRVKEINGEEGSIITVTAEYFRPNIFTVFTFREQVLTLKIPVKYSGKIEFTKSAGNISTPYGLTNQLKEVSVSDCRGNLRLDISDIETLHADNIRGNINVDSNISKELKIVQNRGNCKISNITEKDCRVALDDIRGNLRLNYTNPSPTSVLNNRGNINITFENNDDILLMTEDVRGVISGDYSMNRDGVDFILKGVRGNIKISGNRGN